MNQPSTAGERSRTIVPRIEDLPYWTSPPIQFIYESTATLAGGAYYWNDAPSPLLTPRPILDSAMYYFRSVSLAANIAELDFENNSVSTVLVKPPSFYMFLLSDAKTVLFREPITMNKYYDQFDYRLVWSRSRGNDQLLAAFTGQLTQGPGLIGKNSITLKATISAQEIVDDKFIDMVKYHGFPEKEKS